MNGDRSEVGVDVQQFAKRKQAGLWTQLARRVVERRIAHGAKQHRVALHHGGTGLGRQRIVRHGDRCGADRQSLERKPQAESLAHGLEYAQRCAITSGPMPSPGSTAMR